MAVFGTSTGGGMTLALGLRIKDEKMPQPAAMAPGTPWADLAEVGDTYFTTSSRTTSSCPGKAGWVGPRGYTPTAAT